MFKVGYTTFFVDYLFSASKPVLSGLFSFVVYDYPNKTFAMRQFENYQSRHGAIDLIVQATHRRLSPAGKSNNQANRFFQPLRPRSLCGGEILLTEGDDQGSFISFVNYRSGGYTKPNSVFYDTDPSADEATKQARQAALATAFDSLCLPADRYITIEQAKDFESRYLRQHFHPNGQFIDVTNQHSLSRMLCEGLGPFPFAPKPNIDDFSAQKTTEFVMRMGG